MREIAYPSGTRHKDRAAIETMLSALHLDDEQLEPILLIVESALRAGARKVPGWIGNRS